MPEPKAEDVLGEALLWSIGVEAAMLPDPVKLTVDRREKAARVPKIIRSKLTAYLTTKEFGTPKPERPPFDFDQIRELLMQPPRTDVALSNVVGFDNPDQALAFTTASIRAMDYLRNAMPTHFRQTATGPVLEDPPAFEKAKFSWAWNTVEHPETLFDDLSRGCLSHIQARTFAEVYPMLYELAQGMIFDILADQKAEHPRFEVTPQKERHMLVFLGKPSWSPELIKEMQKSFESAPKEQAGGAPIDLHGEDQRTQVQRSAER